MLSRVLKKWLSDIVGYLLAFPVSVDGIFRHWVKTYECYSYDGIICIIIRGCSIGETQRQITYLVYGRIKSPNVKKIGWAMQYGQVVL